MPQIKNLIKKFSNMAKEYINPSVIASTADMLAEYKRSHPKSKTPMADACAGEPIEERARFVRAAKRLGWAVTSSNGKVYENGRLVW